MDIIYHLSSVFSALFSLGMTLFFWQAQKLVQAAEPEHEVAGLPLPLLARAAGHWKARTQQHRHHPALTTAAAEEKPLSPLEELLGRGI